MNEDLQENPLKNQAISIHLEKIPRFPSRGGCYQHDASDNEDVRQHATDDDCE